MKILLCLLALCLMSCELHDQEAYLISEEVSNSQPQEVVDKLFQAVSNNKYFELKELLEEDPKRVDVINSSGSSLLIEAMTKELALIVHLLIEHGSDTSFRGLNGESAFDTIKEDRLFEDDWHNLLTGSDIALELLNFDTISFTKAIAQDTQDVAIKRLELLFSLGADDNAIDSNKNALLVLAATNNLPIVVKYLCGRESVDVNAKFRGRHNLIRVLKKSVRRMPTLKVVIDILIEHGTIAKNR